jgi:catechol 2,3-dioxygenase-like lactoylglutathione lyase family enzyme
MDTLNAAIAKTTLPVEDLARARAFYAEKLGLRPTREFDGALFYEGEGFSGFLLFPSEARPSAHTQMAWFVKDIVAIVAKLKSRGVHFEEYDFPASRPTTASPISDTKRQRGSATARAICLPSASSHNGGTL